MKFFSGVPGSCWKQCDPKKTDKTTGKNPACNNTGNGEACWGYGCLPLGTISGSFSSIPVYTYPNTPADSSAFGTANLTTNIPKVGKVTFTQGYGSTLVGSSLYSHTLFLYPATGLAKELDILIYKSAGYRAGASFDLSKPNTAEIRYVENSFDSSTGKLVRILVRGIAWDGTVMFTKAGTGGKAPATGSVTGRIAHYESELCGSSSTSCK